MPGGITPRRRMAYGIETWGIYRLGNGTDMVRDGLHVHGVGWKKHATIDGLGLWSLTGAFLDVFTALPEKLGIEDA